MQHLIIEDLIGIGVGGMYIDICNHYKKTVGDYVFLLCDDNVLVDKYVVEDLIGRCESLPEVIVWKTKISELRETLPYPWKAKPQLGRIDISSFVLRRDVWMMVADWWSDDYASDFQVIDRLWRENYRFEWFDRLAVIGLEVHAGRPEMVHDE